ncbi:uncharacterized protein LOC122261999 [Penaeus japonicus]|uniref:uncharacterized protein LOC122261999 n=1 Tax=Penaeus japonicus TaxID=27405 RepID=UPI001C712C53|nr:uncharacterized protein LOC122261999 [Penaeus japonicus]
MLQIAAQRHIAATLFICNIRTEIKSDKKDQFAPGNESVSTLTEAKVFDMYPYGTHFLASSFWWMRRGLQFSQRHHKPQVFSEMKNREILQKHLVLWLLMLQTHPLTDAPTAGRWTGGASATRAGKGLVASITWTSTPSRFLIHAATVVLPVNASGVVYRAWSTDDDLGLTCPLGPGESARCPCASVTYQLFSGPGDRHFVLDPDTGVLSRISSTSLQPGRSYKYKIMVQGAPEGKQKVDLQYDLLDLKVYVTEDHVRKIPWT